MPFSCPDWPPKLPEIADRISELLKCGDWGRYKTPHQDELRSGLRQLCGGEFGAAEHVRLCGSGSAAVELALRGAGIGPGDQVIVAAYDYPGNFRAIESVGATPVLVDVAPGKVTINIDQVAALGAAHSVASTKETELSVDSQIRAVVASHLYGTAAPVASLRAICDDNNWYLIEDTCQTPGMKIGEHTAGSFGDIATLSFGGSKPLTSGCGGAVVTNDDRVAAKLRGLLDRPSDSQPLSSLQAATLLPQLNHLDRLNAQRQATVRYLESEVNSQLGTWQWLSQMQPDVSATHYKVAWSVETAEERAAAISACTGQQLPIGDGFRSLAGCSERRCRKPFPLDRSRHLGETVIVLDHAALLLEKGSYNTLGESLIAAHRAI